jgi:tetratricopeptide (TPR) repeat protein
VSTPDEERGKYRIENQQPVQGQVIGEYNTVYNIYGSVYNSSSSSREEREERLRLLLSDHSSFLRDRLESFVGRQRELEALRQLITERQQTGGYITITGQAGQGKSSIIAKLVHDTGRVQVAHHFIPINPGPDHQIGLLRNLMARLILKYELAELFVVSESRAVLRDNFPKVLAEVAGKGGKEVIFIDGLDQLEEEITGVRDLSFLPTSPPSGIVFVLGTRPNDTLKPLELLKPHDEYRLPNLSRADFDRILQHRVVHLESVFVDRLYQVMGGNAFYLDLIVRELEENAGDDLPALITQLADNPDHIFSVALERLKHHGVLWQQIMYPVLGVLLVAREPLGRQPIRQIVGVEDDRLRDGLLRLGGLVIPDGQERYSLFHRKFYDYLRQDEHRPEKEYLFATDEEQAWHTRLAHWCEQDDLAQIWQDSPFQPAEHQQRLYAREHYLTHLYLARKWPRLFAILDTGSYGRNKIRVSDPSTRSYALDLDLGRRAAAWEGWTLQDGISYLPFLWRYTLLRCSLRSRADQYPLATFRLLLRLGREREVIGLADLLTNPSLKVSVLLELARYFVSLPQRKAEGDQCFLRAWEVARSVGDGYQKVTALRDLAGAFTHYDEEQADVVWQEAEEAARSIRARSLMENYQQAEALRELAQTLVKAKREAQAEAIWQEAEEATRSIHFMDDVFRENLFKAGALRELTGALAKAQRWEQAEAAARSIGDGYQRACALGALAGELFGARREDQAEAMWQEAEAMTSSIEESSHRAEALRVLAEGLTQAQRWGQAEVMARSIKDEYQQAWALRELATTLTQARREEQSEAIWRAAEETARSIKQNTQRAEALRELTEALAKAQRWEQAEAAARSIGDGYQQTWALSLLAFSLLTDNQRDQAQYLCDQAEGVIATITWDQAGARALRELGAALTQAQRVDLAATVWQEAESAARSVGDRNQQPQVLRELTEALTQAQCWEQAEAVARSIEQGDQQAWALRVLAGALSQAQRWEQAEAVARSIELRHEKAWALRVLAGALSQAQCEEHADTVWQEAEKAVRSIEQYDQKAGMLWELASALAQAQRWSQAEVIWQEAERVARSIKEDDRKAGILRILVEALTKVQRWEQAEAVARSIEQSYHQAGALHILAEALEQAQCEEQAEAIWQEAERVARSIEESFQKAEALRELAEALSRVQRKGQAEASWREAEETARSIAFPFWKFGALRALAVALTTARREERAEAIWQEVKEIAHSLEDLGEEMVLSDLVMALTQVQRWDQAEEVARSIKQSFMKTIVMNELAKALVQAQRWDRLERIVRSHEQDFLNAEVLRSFALALLQQNDYQGTLRIVQHTWLQAETKETALNLLSLSFGLVAHWPEMGSALYSAFLWVHTFLSAV